MKNFQTLEFGGVSDLVEFWNVQPQSALNFSISLEFIRLSLWLFWFEVFSQWFVKPVNKTWLIFQVVLSACSSYFQKLLMENPCKHPTIILPQEVGFSDLKFIIDFVYRGEIDVSQAQLQVGTNNYLSWSFFPLSWIAPGKPNLAICGFNFEISLSTTQTL